MKSKLFTLATPMALVLIFIMLIPVTYAAYKYHVEITGQILGSYDTNNWNHDWAWLYFDTVPPESTTSFPFEDQLLYGEVWINKGKGSFVFITSIGHYLEVSGGTVTKGKGGFGIKFSADPAFILIYGGGYIWEGTLTFTVTVTSLPN